MLVEGTWQVIDFDVSCRIGDKFGNKAPSSGYCPPEMARVLLEADGDGDKLKGYVADTAHDLW